ncbi:MAG: hypothetical protein AB1798_15515 [Spirochaetota bacterium]
MKSDKKTVEHFRGFSEIWHGGYFEGDPLDPMGPSKYRRLGYISLLHAVYQVCIRPYIHPKTIALEIGPGRGAWTKGMLCAREVWCLDAKSRDDNRIDEYLGYPSNLVYHQVHDFSCSMLPDDRFTYLFSFGCLCHVPWDGICQYATNLYGKLKEGAEAFWMVADYEKRNEISRNFYRYDVHFRTLPSRVFRVLEWWNRWDSGRYWGPDNEPPLDKESDALQGNPGRWYHSGAARTAEMLRRIGYHVVSEDIGLLPRDALLHFRKS